MVASTTTQNVTEVMADNTTITGVLTINYPKGLNPAGYHLTTDLGDVIVLIPNPAVEGDLYRYNGAAIEVTGNLVGGILYMENWVPLGGTMAATISTISGPQNTLIILFQTSDHAGTNTVAHFQDVLTGPSPSMNAYFVEDSYNMITVTGSVAGPAGPPPTPQWYTLPQVSSFYPVQTWQDCINGAGYTTLAQAIVAAVDSDVNFADYIPNGHIYFVSSDAWVWGCSLHWGGGGISTGDGVGITHAPFVSENDGLSVYLHEFSHDMGLPDLYDYTSPYDPYQFIDGWDLMSMDNAQHHSSYCKIDLGWITSSEIVTFTGAATVTATIDRIESSITSGYHTLKIQTSGMPATFYFLVETRQKIGFDATGIPASAPDHGVLITMIDTTAGNGAGIVREVDANPATQITSDGDALWQVGQTYVDGTYPFSVAIQSWNSTGFVITVSTNALYQVAFTQTGSPVAPTVEYRIDSGSMATGTVPFAVWADTGLNISYTYQSPVPGAAAGVQYVLTGVSPASPQTVNGPLTIAGSYKTQWEVTFYQSGVGNDFAGTVATIAGTDYGQSALTTGVGVWVDDTTGTISFEFKSPLSPVAGKQYVWTSTTGLSTAQSGSITGVTASGSVTGNYKTQYSLTTGVAYGGGSVSPNCPSGCWTDPGSPISVAATPDPGWAFSSWTITGASCSGGASSNPCTFTMPDNPVSVYATFTYTVTFKQVGIPPWVRWGVVVGGTRYTSITSSVTRSGLSGTVTYSYDSSVPAFGGGSYTCVSGCSGSVTGPTTVTATYQPQLVVTLVSPSNGATVRLLSSVQLQVRVTGPGGRPVSGAQVSIYVNGAVPLGCSGKTDSTGRFYC
ncbi:MAG: hypothetical protein LUO89_10310, partial [Methanothrix sp.]|nr:hypothetical protein [Methanothrix sp.]